MERSFPGERPILAPKLRCKKWIVVTQVVRNSPLDPRGPSLAIMSFDRWDVVEDHVGSARDRNGRIRNLYHSGHTLPGNRITESNSGGHTPRTGTCTILSTMVSSFRDITIILYRSNKCYLLVVFVRNYFIFYLRINVYACDRYLDDRGFGAASRVCAILTERAMHDTFDDDQSVPEYSFDGPMDSPAPPHQKFRSDNSPRHRCSPESALRPPHTREVVHRGEDDPGDECVLGATALRRNVPHRR